MYIFRDIINGKEVISDAFPFSEVCDGMLIKFIGKSVVKQGGIDESLIGGNKSAEDPDECGTDDQAQTKINVLDFDIQEVPALDKKAFQVFMKDYCKKVKAKLIEDGQEEEAKKFVAGAPAAMKYLAKSLKDFEFYVPSDNDPEGGYGYLNWEECDGVEHPYILYFKHGLIKEKV